MEEQIEQPILLEAPLTPSLEAGPGEPYPDRIIHVLGNVRFAPGSSVLRPPERSRLDAFVAELRRTYPKGDYALEVQGHTDATGDERANLRLARARAEVVGRYLQEKLRIPADRIAIVPAAALSPAADEATAEGRSRNRRVVVLVLR